MSEPRLLVSVAHTPEELLEARHLRHEIYRAQGMVGTRPEGLELDAWDSESTTLVAWGFDGRERRGRLMGSIRICSEVHGDFPMEKHGFRLPDWLSRDDVRETSRWVARPSRSARTALGLTIAVDHWLRARRLTHSVSVVVPPSLRALERGPWEILPIGPVGSVTLDSGKPLTVVPICMPVLPEPPRPPDGVSITLDFPVSLVGA